VLGALAIISAVLIVLADRERRSNTPVEQTVTDTVTPDTIAPGAPAAPAAPSGWTDRSGPDDPATLPATLRISDPETAGSLKQTALAPHDGAAL
jgi:serine/threonine-protein kinase